MSVDTARTTVWDFYAGLRPPIVAGIEASGAIGWFVRFIEQLGMTCSVGHPAKIQKNETRRQNMIGAMQRCF